MSRRNIPTDTKYFHYFNANPKGKSTSDCVIRALCGVLPRKSYEQICKELLEVSLKYGYFVNDKKCYEKYLQLNGFEKMKQPKKQNGTKFTGKDFCAMVNEFSMYFPERIFAHIGGHHVVAIVGGRINDIWDSSNGCIGNYYI